MVSTAHIVEKIVRKKPFIEESMSKGIINYGGLADMIMPEVEKEAGGKVKHSAVMMALRRYAEKSQQSRFTKFKFRKQTDITIRSDLVEITIYKTPESMSVIKKIQEKIDSRKGEFISTITGINEISIITNQRREDEIIKVIEREDIKKITRNISSLTINIPEESTEMIGMFYTIIKSLAWEHISIIEIISTWTETSYIFKTKDVAKAFETIKTVIEEHS